MLENRTGFAATWFLRFARGVLRANPRVWLDQLILFGLKPGVVDGKELCFRLDFPLWWALAHWVCFGAPRAPPLRAGAQQQIKVHLKSPGRQLPDQVREPPRPCPGAPRGCTEHCRVQASQPGKDQISVPHRSSNERICVKSAFANDFLLVLTTFTIITGSAWLVRMWKPFVDRSNSAGPVRPRQLRRGPTVSRASHVLHRDADCE